MAADRDSRRRRRDPFAGPIIQGNIYEENNRNENGIPEQRHVSSLEGENARESRLARESNTSGLQGRPIDSGNSDSVQSIEEDVPTTGDGDPSEQTAPSEGTRRIHHRKKRRLPPGQTSPVAKKPFSVVGVGPPAVEPKDTQDVRPRVTLDQGKLPVVQEVDSDLAVTSTVRDTAVGKEPPPSRGSNACAANAQKLRSNKVSNGYPTLDIHQLLYQQQQQRQAGSLPFQRQPSQAPPHPSDMRDLHVNRRTEPLQTQAFILPTPRVGFPSPLMALNVPSPHVPSLPSITIPPVVRPDANVDEVLEDRVNGIDNEDVTAADVLRGTGDRYTCFQGNKIFRSVVNNCYHLYQSATAKGSKRLIAKTVVAQVRTTVGGRFLQFDEDKQLWFEIGDEKAIDKVLALFRDITKARARTTGPTSSAEAIPAQVAMPKPSTLHAIRIHIPPRNDLDLVKRNVRSKPEAVAIRTPKPPPKDPLRDPSEVLPDEINGINNKDVGPCDVLQGTGQKRSEGNKTLRRLVSDRLTEYSNAKASKRRNVAKAVVTEVRSKLGGRFLKLDKTKNLWFEVGDEKAIEKTMSVFRDIARSNK